MQAEQACEHAEIPVGADYEGGARVIVYKDHPEFRPNMTPLQVLHAGAFGGGYFRKIHSGVLGRDVSGDYKEFGWDIDENLLTRDLPDVKLNKFKVHAGTSLADWESKGWIKAQDPRGFFQWWCRFHYHGRRTADDARQIKRWLAFAGPKGRFFVRVVNMHKRAHKKHPDPSISPVIQQSLLHWGRVLTDIDLE
jgi:hypothetical protein